MLEILTFKNNILPGISFETKTTERSSPSCMRLSKSVLLGDGTCLGVLAPSKCFFKPRAAP